MRGDIDELVFVRIYDFNLIPSRLFEQIPNRNWEVSKLYEYGHVFVQNPFNYLYAMSDETYEIKGVLWMTLDPVMEILCVNVYSVNKEYMNHGAGLSKAIQKAIPFMKEIAKEEGFKPTILWSTTRPRAFERAGCKRFNRVIMEI